MVRFLENSCRTIELYNKKLIFFQPDERLVIAVYIPSKINKGNNAYVGTSVRVFAFPTSQGPDSVQYKVVPTKINYHLSFDEHSFQLYDGKIQNTFIFLVGCQHAAFSRSKRKSKSTGSKQEREETSDATQFDCRVSIALGKISQDIAKHVGLINRAGILAAVSQNNASSIRLANNRFTHH